MSLYFVSACKTSHYVHINSPYPPYPGLWPALLLTIPAISACSRAPVSGGWWVAGLGRGWKCQ